MEQCQPHHPPWKDQIQTSDTHHTLSIESEQFDDYVSSTEDLNFTQEEMFGFTYTIAKFRYEVLDIDVLVAYAKAGIDVDVEFGLKLPVRILMEYPRSMVAETIIPYLQLYTRLMSQTSTSCYSSSKKNYGFEIWAVGFRTVSYCGVRTLISQLASQRH